METVSGKNIIGGGVKFIAEILNFKLSFFRIIIKPVQNTQNSVKIAEKKT